MTWIEGRVGPAERRQITALFCDIVGSTALAAGLDPEDVTGVLRRYRATVAAVIERHKGFVARYAGDGVLAYWGYPAASDEDARLAVSAALEITSALAGELDVRCALDAGIVLVDTAGPRGCREIEIVGDAPNVAAKLQAAAPANAVLVTETVMRLTAGSIELEPFELPAPLHSAVGHAWRAREGREGWRRSAQTTETMVGRAAELAVLKACWTATCSGGSRRIVIEGEAGLGKSTLLRQLRQIVTASGGAWIEAGCLPELQHCALHPIRQAMRELLVPAAARPRERAAHLRSAIVRLAGAEASDRSLLERFLSPGAAVVEPAPTHDRGTSQRLLGLLVRALASRAGREPLALVLEDAHWADDATSTLVVEAGNRLTEAAGVCLVVTSRARGACADWTGQGHSRIRLTALRDADIEAMLAAGEGADRLDPRVLKWIAARSEGNPFFAEELARLCAGAETWQETNLLAAPSGLAATLAARLDSLGDLKPLAQAASVLGRDFDSRHLAAMLEIETGGLRAGLTGIVRSGILGPGRREGASHSFSHCLLREAAYASILRDRRCMLHRRAGEILAEACRCGSIVQPEEVAIHFEEAGEPGRALVWWRHAAERAIRISATAAAVSHLERALAAKAADPEACTVAAEVELLSMLAPQLVMMHGNASPAVIEIYRRCLEQCPSGADAADRVAFDLLWGLHTCTMVCGNAIEGMALGDRLVAAAEQSACEERILLAHRVQGLAKLQAGRLEAALAHYARVRAVYVPERHAGLSLRYASDQGAIALAQEAWAQALAGRQAISRLRADEALAIAGRLRHPHTCAHTLGVLAARAQMLGERDAAATLAHGSKAVADQNGFRYWSAWAAIVLGAVTSARNPTEGVAALEQAVAAYVRTGARQALPWAHGLLAVALGRDGRWQAAGTVAAGALDMAGATGLELYSAELHRIRAMALARLGASIDTVMGELECGAAIAERQGAHLLAARIAATRLAIGPPLQPPAAISAAQIPASPPEMSAADDMPAPLPASITR
jgi:predicted ATPase/class 3 adenylate cyclase